MQTKIGGHQRRFRDIVRENSLRSFKFKILKMTSWRQTILVKFYLRVYDL